MLPVHTQLLHYILNIIGVSWGSKKAWSPPKLTPSARALFVLFLPSKSGSLPPAAALQSLLYRDSINPTFPRWYLRHSGFPQKLICPDNRPKDWSPGITWQIPFKLRHNNKQKADNDSSERPHRGRTPSRAARRGSANPSDRWQPGAWGSGGKRARWFMHVLISPRRAERD